MPATETRTAPKLSKTARAYLAQAKRGRFTASFGRGGHGTHRRDVLTKLERLGIIREVDRTSSRAVETCYHHAVTYTDVTYEIVAR